MLRPAAGLETRDTADLEVCATGHPCLPCRVAQCSPRPRSRRHRRFEIRKDDGAGASLQQAQNLHLGLLTDEALGLVHDHHGAVAEVGDPLPFLAAFADDVDLEGLARMDQGFQRTGDFRNADVGNGLKRVLRKFA